MCLPLQIRCALLQPGEVVNPLTANNWRWQINFTPEFVGEVNLHTVLEIDGMAATFDTLLRLHPSYGTEMDPLGIVQAQRVTAIPEPDGILTLLCALSMLRYRVSRNVENRAAMSTDDAVGW